MPTVGSTSKPAYVYDAGTDTWIPIGPGEHSHAYIPNTLVDAKGDILTATASDTPAILSAGTNGQYLSANSSTATGLQWVAAPTASSNWSLLNSGGTSLSGTLTTISGISAKDKIMILVGGVRLSTAGIAWGIRINGDSTSKYNMFGYSDVGGDFLQNNSTDTKIFLAQFPQSTNPTCSGAVTLTGCNSAGVKAFQSVGSRDSQGHAGGQAYINQGFYNSSNTVTDISVYADGFTFIAGTVYVYTSA